MTRSDARPGLLAIDAAIATILGQVVPLASEDVALAEALGRFLAEPVTAAIDLPPFTNTAMDGYAAAAAAVDTAAAHREALSAALEHDVVISSGGVSVGPHDLVRDVGRELGIEEVFWRVALRPGKPLSFGVRGGWPAGQRGGWPAGQPPQQRTLFFGLPGNPVSTLVCFELFVRPALYALQGASAPAPEFRSGTLATAVAQNPERDDLIRVRVTADGALEPLRGQQSHQIAITALSDGLARIPTGTGEIPAGSEVAFLPLHEP